MKGISLNAASRIFGVAGFTDFKQNSELGFYECRRGENTFQAKTLTELCQKVVLHLGGETPQQSTGDVVTGDVVTDKKALVTPVTT